MLVATLLYHLFIFHTDFALFNIFMFTIHAQIARLKSALAVKDSGSEQIMSRDSEAFNMKMPSPGFSNKRQGSCDLLSSQTNFRQPMEDVGNIEVTMFLTSHLCLPCTFYNPNF